MNTNALNVDDFDPESQNLLQGMKFLDMDSIDFEGRQNGFGSLTSPKSQKPTTPFTQFYSNEIAQNNNYKTVVNQEKLKVYTDEEITLDGGTLKEVILYNNRHSKTIDGITISLFISKNGAKILRQYKEVIPSSNEIVLFIEKDDKNNVFGSVLRCKVGTNIEKNKNLPYSDIVQFSKENLASLNAKQVDELIKNQLYKNKLSLFGWLTNVLSHALDEVFSFFTKNVLGGVGDFFEKNVATAIADFKVKETRWNPNVENGTYKPLFLPNALVKNLENSNRETNLNKQAKWVGELLKPFEEKINNADKFFMGLLQDAKVFMPKLIYNRLKTVLQFLFKQLHGITKAMQDPTVGLQHLFFQIPQVVNAFLCGLLNSIIDIFAGIFQLIGFLLNGIATALSTGNDLKNNALHYGALFAEVIENVIGTLRDFDFLDFIKQAVFFQIKVTQQIYRSVVNTINETSLAEYFYYYGYLIGMIIETLAEIFFTAGSATVAKWSAKITKLTEKTLGKLATFVKAFLAKAKTVLDKVLDFIDLLLSKLKKGAKHLFDEFSKIVDEIFASGKKVEDLPRTKAEKRVLAKKEARTKRLEEKKNRAKEKGKFNLEDTDALGSKPATIEEISEWEKKIKILSFKEKGRFKLAIKNTSAYRYMEKNKVAAYFDAHEIPPVIWYKEGSSNYVIAHEYYHLEEYCKIGREAFIKGDLGTLKEAYVNNILREKYVVERLLENAEELNLSQNELSHIKQYYQIDIIVEAVKNGVEILPEFIIKFKNYGL